MKSYQNCSDYISRPVESTTAVCAVIARQPSWVTAVGFAVGTVDVQIPIELLYIEDMDVAISTLRAELSTWIERARAGEEVVVTDRGTPVARLLAVDTAPLLDRLIERGVLNRPRRADRPAARGVARAHASGPVSELVSEQRR